MSIPQNIQVKDASTKSSFCSCPCWTWKPRHYAYLLVLILILLRLPSFFIEVMDVDEAIYSLFTRIWFEGGLPYIDAVETKPLGIYFFYGLIFKIFGRYNIIPVHAVTTLVVGATAFVIYKISALLHSKRAGWWAALLYIVFSTTYIPKMLATTIEPIMLLPITLQFYYWLLFEREGRQKFAFASGAAFAAAFLFKYQAGINLVIMFMYICFIRPIFVRQLTWKDIIKGIGAFIAGGIWLPALMLGYLAKIGSLNAFYFWSILGSYDYIGGGSSTFDFIHQLATRVLPFVASTLILWILVGTRLVALAQMLFGLHRRSPRARQEWLICLWFLLTMIPVATGKRFYGHYFLLIVPPMAIMAAPVLEKVWHEMKKKWLAGLIIFAIAVPAIGFSIPRYFISEVNHAFHEDNPEDYRPLAQYVEMNTSPHDRIIAWGYAPLIYWYSGRLPATRFFWSDVLTGRVPGLKRDPHPDTSFFTTPGSWEMFFADLERHKPVYFIDTTPANLHDYKQYPVEKYPRLQKYLDDHYQMETTLNGVVFYKKNPEK